MEFLGVNTLLVALIIVFAHFVETITGFGATVIALALAVHLIPIKTLVVALVLIGWLQSAWIVARGFRHIRWDIFFKRILLFSAFGLPFGIWGFSELASSQLKIALGIFVMAVASLELFRLYRKSPASKPMSAWKGFILLFGGGFFHGLFASGGPLIVYYSSRQIEGKKSFKATISLLWLILNTVLIISYLLGSKMEGQSLRLAIYLLPALAVGIFLGEIFHAKIEESAFRKFVYVILFLTGVFLLT